MKLTILSTICLLLHSAFAERFSNETHSNHTLTNADTISQTTEVNTDVVGLATNETLFQPAVITVDANLMGMADTLACQENVTTLTVYVVDAEATANTNSYRCTKTVTQYLRTIPTNIIDRHVTSQIEQEVLVSKTPRVVLPAVNVDIDRNDINHLVPSLTAKLCYAEPEQGKGEVGRYAVSMLFEMNHLQVTLEDSAHIVSVVCRGDHLVITLDSLIAFDVVRHWPQTGFVLITNTAGCNGYEERGAYLVESHSLLPNSYVIKVQVRITRLKEVAHTIVVDYGQITADKLGNTVNSKSSVSSQAISFMFSFFPRLHLQSLP